MSRNRRRVALPKGFILVLILILGFLPLISDGRSWKTSELLLRSNGGGSGSYQSYCTRESDCDSSRNLRCDFWHHKCACVDIHDLKKLMHFSYVTIDGGCVLTINRGRPCANVALSPVPRLGTCQSHNDCSDRHGVPFVSCDYQTCACYCDETDGGRRVRVLNGTCALAKGFEEPCSTSDDCEMENNVFCNHEPGTGHRCTCNAGDVWNPENRECEPPPPGPCESDEDCNSEESYGMYAKCDRVNKTCVCLDNARMHNDICVRLMEAVPGPGPEPKLRTGCPEGEQCDSHLVETKPEVKNEETGTVRPVSFWYFISAAGALLAVIAVAAFISRRRSWNQCKGSAEEIRLLPVPPWPLNSSSQLPHISKADFFVDREDILGEGKGGIVYGGTFGNLPVAVKTLNPNCQRVDMYLNAMHHEIEIFKAIPEHPNIIKLLAYSYLSTEAAAGAGLQSWDCYILMELCSLGSLKDFLQGNSYCDSKVYVTNVQEFATGYNDQNLLCFACQIAEGAEFLAEQRVVHADLACRNVLLNLVNGERRAKITDFGLARMLGDSSTYTKSKPELIAWKWAAPEVLMRNEFSTASDVWSYGVLLWELFSRGEEPYQGVTPQPSFPHEVYQGKWELPKPQLASIHLYNLMTECWKPEPTSRISFTEIWGQLGRLSSVDFSVDVDLAPTPIMNELLE